MQEISERLVREGHEVHISTTDARDPEYFWMANKEKIGCPEDVHNGVRIQRFSIRHLPFSEVVYPHTRKAISLLSKLPIDTSRAMSVAARTTPYVPGLHRELESTSERYDLVHAANVLFEPLVSAALKHARSRRIPFVLTPFVHLGEPKDDTVRRDYTNRYQLHMIASADRVIVQTDIERNYLARLGVPMGRMAKVGVGINPEEVLGGDGDRFRRSHGVEGPIVFFIGAQSFDKGAQHLIEAMMLLWKRGRKATLVLLGPLTEHFGKYFQALPDEVKRNCLQLGSAADETKRDLLSAGDVFAMPSRVESFGIVYLEAWLYQKPVIGALAGGVPDVIQHNRDGILVPYGDTVEMARSISRLLDDPSLAREFGERGREKVLSEHRWETKYELIRNLYQELC